jgi:PHD/YefM family antitoxin component YafN of YafNO toxin-antitoxin module
MLLKNRNTETQYITDSGGKKAGVLLPLKKYEKMLEELEDLHDRKLYDEAKKNDDGTRIAFSEYLKKRKAKHG